MGGVRDGGAHKDGDGNLYCHVCNVSVYDDESFRRHLNGTKHAARMNSLLTISEMKSNQLKSRLKAEEHLRNIERKGGRDPDFFCKICNNDLTIPWKRHCFSNIHKQRLLQVRRGCGWCNVHDFNNFSEVLEHRETEQHRKNSDIYGKKDKEDRERRRSHSKERKTEKTDRKPKVKEEEEDLTIPEYDAEKAMGVNYIIPVTGFFCKLCHKFYNNEKSAKGAHCQSETHYEKFKLALEAKIEAREKRKAEEAAEEAKIKEEEEKVQKGTEEMKKEAGTEEEDMEEENGKDEEALSHHAVDDEDYDDDVPLDDDGEGGILETDMEDDGGLLAPGQGQHGAFLDDTNADASFEFLSGDMAQAHLELQKAEEMIMERQRQKDDAAQGSEEAAVEESTSEAEPTEPVSAEAAPVVSEEPVEAAETVPEKPTRTTARRGTARRGRGRGRGKK